MEKRSQANSPSEQTQKSTTRGPYFTRYSSIVKKKEPVLDTLCDDLPNTFPSDHSMVNLGAVIAASRSANSPETKAKWLNSSRATRN